jgi:hypothetical protein
MLWVEFEPRIAVFEWAKTFNALDRAATFIDNNAQQCGLDRRSRLGFQISVLTVLILTPENWLCFVRSVGNSYKYWQVGSKVGSELTVMKWGADFNCASYICPIIVKYFNFTYRRSFSRNNSLYTFTYFSFKKESNCLNRAMGTSHIESQQISTTLFTLG